MGFPLEIFTVLFAIRARPAGCALVGAARAGPEDRPPRQVYTGPPATNYAAIETR